MWQFSLSWGGVSGEERHRAPGWSDGQAARDARNSPQATRAQRDAFLASFLLASPLPKTMRGGRAGGQHPPHRLPESNLIAAGDDAKNSHQTWHQRHGQASPSPFRLGDIAGAGPHEPNALLLIPLKLRDGAHALSGLPPLANILLTPKPKKTRPPHLEAGHERQRKTLRLRRC